jgi:hypothetical protein
MKRALWAIFILMLLVPACGCGDAGEGSDSRYIDVSIRAGSPPMLAQVWREIAAEGRFDGGSARLQGITLTCTARVARLGLSVDAITPDGRLINVTARQADNREDAALHVTGDIGSNHGVQVPTTGLVAPMLAALDRVGIERLIRTSGDGQTDLYAIHVLQDTSDNSPGIPESSTAYRWDGRRFVPMPVDDPERARDSSELLVVVFPQQRITSTETGPPQSGQTTTTGAHHSLSPTYFVIPL